ncbi:hypothetical protein KR044_005118 [Drosophila immigrans]|nr:hypothetical protein KR044_005118 [Drosophila immigrans]
MPIAARVTLSNDQSRDFMAIFPDVVLELTNIIRTYKCNDAATWFAKALQYNVPQGRKTRGLLTVFAYKNLVRPEDLTTENMKLAYYLGWCVELLQSYLIVVDDVMDHSPTRRGLKCWHQVENVGLTAINDALMLENALYLLLKQHFSHLDCYVPILELFHEISFITNCGQSLDALNSYKRVSDFTMEDYVTIAENKTAYYTFYLPFAIAMYLAG